MTTATDTTTARCTERYTPPGLFLSVECGKPAKVSVRSMKPGGRAAYRCGVHARYYKSRPGNWIVEPIA